MIKLKRQPIFFYFALYSLFTLFCSHHDIWSRIKKSDFEMVERGTYHGRLKYLPHPMEFERLVEKYRKEIERNIDLLPVITKRFFFVDEELNYLYKFTWKDEANNCLVLRYFAPIFHHKFLAGYQIQFVFDIKKDRIIKVFVSEVPLE